MKITSKVPSLKLRSRTRAPDCFGPSLLERPGEFADQVKSTIWMWFKILQEQESDVDSAHRSKTQGVLAKYTEVNYSDERSTSVYKNKNKNKKDFDKEVALMPFSSTSCGGRQCKRDVEQALAPLAETKHDLGIVWDDMSGWRGWKFGPKRRILDGVPGLRGELACRSSEQGFRASGDLHHTGSREIIPEDSARRERYGFPQSWHHLVSEQTGVSGTPIPDNFPLYFLPSRRWLSNKTTRTSIQAETWPGPSKSWSLTMNVLLITDWDLAPA
ncbi:uncharacterized protein CIMG_12790 [Coccidioides immitis RS]|uniref:Uncharacterized protein n=1 Tax=Coccidioides immitis (strain RS) TaxID=246410 RepID=J3KJ42_COCIM|nr:uncharacterized protein CIMG_12790 [Coccidioides immitis RS]EAS36041.3 hypothetical protein CIMG_12790 [Coccidioides immitis RS]